MNKSMDIGPKTYRLVNVSTKVSSGGIESPVIGEAFGELMTRNQAESLSKAMGNTTYFNVGAE